MGRTTRRAVGAVVAALAVLLLAPAALGAWAPGTGDGTRPPAEGQYPPGATDPAAPSGPDGGTGAPEPADPTAATPGAGAPSDGGSSALPVVLALVGVAVVGGGAWAIRRAT